MPSPRLTDYHQFQALLPEALFGHLRNANLSQGRGDFLSSVVWGSVFLEAYLGFLLDEIEAPPGKDQELNSRIERLRLILKGKLPCPGADKVSEDVVRRSDELRLLRNRTVHDTGATKSTLAEDSTLALASIRTILEAHVRAFPKDGTGEDASTVRTPELGKALICCNSPHNADQTDFLEGLRQRLADAGIAADRIEFSEYDKKDPWGKVVTEMGKVDSVVIIGMERSHSYFLLEKPGSEDEVEVLHRKYTSSWLHAEAGMAHALGKPIHVLSEAGVCPDGIFDVHMNSYTPQTLSSLDPADQAVSVMIRQMVREMTS